ncbi:hypothetical protein [Bacillus alkalicellulosilyticus]|nr:hypothetical protein [Bacillus alkalicellulosilyticus]
MDFSQLKTSIEHQLKRTTKENEQDFIKWLVQKSQLKKTNQQHPVKQ